MRIRKTFTVEKKHHKSTKKQQFSQLASGGSQLGARTPSHPSLHQGRVLLWVPGILPPPASVWIFYLNKVALFSTTCLFDEGSLPGEKISFEFQAQNYYSWGEACLLRFVSAGIENLFSLGFLAIVTTEDFNLAHWFGITFLLFFLATWGTRDSESLGLGYIRKRVHVLSTEEISCSDRISSEVPDMSASKTVQFSFRGRVIWDSAEGEVFLARVTFNISEETYGCWGLGVYTIPEVLALLVLFQLWQLIHMFECFWLCKSPDFI